MPIRRIALIYDDQARPETTGGYCKHALAQLAEVRHFRPAEVPAIPPREFDLYLNIDDGLRYRLPEVLRPAAWWMIDTHLDADWYRGKARDFDLVFAAQQDAALRFQREAVADVRWLPLACDPDIHRRHEVAEQFDVCFVGNVFPGVRSDLLKLICRRYPRSFIGQCYFEEMARMYSASRVVFNRSVKNDLNMRVFEALACGSMLLTNALPDNGQEELFQHGVHLETYECADDMLDKLKYYLAHDEARQRIASAGQREAIAKHTYRQRMEEILRTVERPSTAFNRPKNDFRTCEGDSPIFVERKLGQSPSCSDLPPKSVPRIDISYYDMPRPDVLALIPNTARRVLDIGCGAGNLGACLKARQAAEVVGVELVAEAAAIARSRIDQVIVGDIESPEIDFPPGSFDCIVCADVLEHLRDPASVLRRLRTWLDGGPLIASIPNIQHHSVVASLLAGNWTYETAGLLDATHLRFFTRREIEKLLFRAGFQIGSIQPAPSVEFQRWQEEHRPREVKIGGLHITGMTVEQAQDFHVVQYLITAVKTAAQDFGLTSIVIPVHNQLAYTRQCLESIRFRTDEPYEIIVVDNGSSDGTADYLRCQPDVLLIENPENRGFPAACNQGIRASRGKQVLLLNNDVVVPTGWLHRLLRALHSNSKHGIAGPCSNCVSGIQQIPVGYTNLGEMDGFAWDHGRLHEGKCEITDRLVGFCMLIRREVIERIGLLDEQFGVGCFEDDDYCRRAAEAGFRLLVVKDAFVHHFGSRTFLGSGIDLAEALRQNERLFHSKWSRAGEEAPKGEEQSARSRARFGLEKSADGSLRLKRTTTALSLCMIVRDNERTIEACLKSIKPWVDEMIVVDTGSRDATAELARRCGAKVHHFPWCDDFSAARNESLKFAAGDWVFWMDSDDTISETNGHKLRALALDGAAVAAMGYVMQVHCPGEGAADCTVVDHVKLFRNRADLRFEGRIHEQILPAIRRAGGEVVFTDIFVVHSGTDQSAAGRKAKLDRDFRLLELDLAERPDHPFVLFNLGMTLADAGQHEEAVQALRRCIDVSNSAESHVRKAYALLAGSLSVLGRREAAGETCRKGRHLYPEDAELLFREAVFHQQFGRLREAEEAYRMLLGKSGQRYFSSVDNGIRGFKARHNLAMVYEQMGDLGKAEEQWREVVKEMPSYRAGWYGLGEVLLRQRKVDLLESLLLQIPQDHDLPGPVKIEKMLLAGRIAAARGRLDEARQLFQRAVELAPDDREAGHCLCQLLFEKGNLAEAEAALRDFLLRFPDDGAAHHNLGVIYLQQGLREKAAAELEESLRCRPDSPSTQAILDQLRAMRGASPES